MFKFLIVIRSIEMQFSLLDTDEFGIGVHSYHGYEIDSEIGWTHISSYTLMFFFFNLKFKKITLSDQPK
jgi:hypothetical protein